MSNREISKCRWFVSVLALVMVAISTASAADSEIFQIIDGGNILGDQIQSFEAPTLAYSSSPPRSIVIEIGIPYMAVDINGDGPLQLAGRIPVPAGSELHVVLINICTAWDLWHPYGSTIYQFRPNPISSNIQWTNYALNLDIPNLSWGATTASVSIIRASDYMKSQSTRISIVPAPTVELGPGAAQDTEPRPSSAFIEFPKVSFEWSRATGQARARAGNLVLANVGFWWDDQNPNVCHLGKFKIDLDQRLVYFVQLDGTEVLTSLGVVVDETTGEDFVYLEPDIWW